jgi:outer membrane receptor protein involved in Fe transport
VWEPVDFLRVRGTRSRDIRAPNFADLFLASASNFGGVLNRFTGTTQFPSTVSGGSPTLDAEKADTTTFGFVFSPKWGWTERARLSVDYYDIKVDGFIGSPGGGQLIMDRCFAGNPLACSLLTFGPGNSLTQVRNINLNLDELRTRGEDIEMSYSLPLARQSFEFRLLASHVEEITTTIFGTKIDRAGQTGNLAATAMPDWLLRANVTWTAGPASVTLQARYIDKGVLDATRLDPSDAGYAPTAVNSTNDNHVASATYFNLFGNYDFSLAGDTSVQVFASVNNLFDKVPPFAPELQYPTNPTYFDQLGRTYHAGVRVRF